MLPGLTTAALHAALLRSDSATAVLDRLCGQAVTIRRGPAPAAVPAPLSLPASPPPTHRRVTLVCGSRALSVADLWFDPSLLPADMAATLATTDTPFGRVVKTLGLRRRPLTARICAPGEPYALEHRALLSTPGQAVAEVWERYVWDLVGGA